MQRVPTDPLCKRWTTANARQAEIASFSAAPSMRQRRPSGPGVDVQCEVLTGEPGVAAQATPHSNL
jgi:hypothetical protein